MIENDNVNSPKHYELNGLNVEVIDVIKATVKDFDSFCHGNVIKYILRAYKKNGIEDLEKAKKYIEMLIGDKKMEDEIIKYTKIYKQKLKIKNVGNKRIALCDIIIQNPKIMLETEKPDLDILYFLEKNNNINVQELKREEYKKKMIAISTIRNFRKSLRDFLEENKVAVDTAEKLKAKGRLVKAALSNKI